MADEKQVEVKTQETQVSTTTSPEDGQAPSQPVPVAPTEVHIEEGGQPQTGGPDKD